MPKSTEFSDQPLVHVRKRICLDKDVIRIFYVRHRNVCETPNFTLLITHSQEIGMCNKGTSYVFPPFYGPGKEKIFKVKHHWKEGGSGGRVFGSELSMMSL